MAEREIMLRLGVITRVLQRAEYIEENEEVVGIELDEQINHVNLILKEIDNEKR